MALGLKSMKPLKALRRVKLSWLFAAFAVAISLHAYYYVMAVLSLPDIPDLYARSWSFQLMAFNMVRLPLWLVGLAVVIALRTFRLPEATRQ